MYLCPCCGSETTTSGALCSECKFKEIEKQEAKKRRHERITALRRAWNGDTVGWDDISPPKKYHGADWQTLPTATQAQITPFIKGDSDLLTLSGCPGAGKTWAAWATVGAFILAHADGRYRNFPGRYFFTNWYRITEAARDSRLYGEEGETNREWLSRLARAELVVIDEFATARPYEAEFMSVMAVIHSRFDNGLPTILITTKNDQEITETLGEAMVSRINSGVVVKMQGRDRRVG